MLQTCFILWQHVTSSAIDTECCGRILAQYVCTLSITTAIAFSVFPPLMRKEKNSAKLITLFSLTDLRIRTKLMVVALKCARHQDKGPEAHEKTAAVSEKRKGFCIKRLRSHR
jgi:hypothetical protein